MHACVWGIGQFVGGLGAFWLREIQDLLTCNDAPHPAAGLSGSGLLACHGHFAQALKVETALESQICSS